MTEKTVPHSQEAEESLIGCTLINPGVLDLVEVRPGHFYIRRLGKIWAAIEGLQSTGMAIDFITVCDWLEGVKQLENVGGAAYMTRLIGSVPSSLHAESYARIVLDYAQRRAAIQQANELAKSAFDLEKPIQSSIGSVITDLHKTTFSPDRLMPITTWAYETREELNVTVEDFRAGNQQHFSTGFKKLDYLIGGGLFSRGEGTYMLLAGPPGLGKSILLQNMVEKLSIQKPTAFFSSEMRRRRLMFRSFSARSKVSAETMKKGSVTDGDLARIDGILAEYDKLPLLLSDSNAWTTASLRAELVRAKYDHGVEVFAFDYLGLLRDRTNYDKKHEHEEEIGLRLRDICRDLEMAGIVIHTMTKEGMNSKKPSQTDLSGGGGLLYDTDITLTMAQSTLLKDSDVWQAIDINQVKGRDSESKHDKCTLGKLHSYPEFITPDIDSIPDSQFLHKPFGLGSRGNL